MPEKDIVDKIAEEFEKQAMEFIESEILAGSGREEDTEKARETVKAVVSFCVEQAKANARSPEEFKTEFDACIKEWFSTLMIISNRFLRKATRKVREEKK